MPEFAFALAKQFMPASIDQIMVALFQKTIFYQQMSLTNVILNFIQNPKLKEVMETSLYLNANDESVGEIRSQRAAAEQNSTIFDHIVG